MHSFTNRHRWSEWVAIGLFLAMAVRWAAAVPVPGHDVRFLNPDETSHIATVAYLASHHAFPPYESLYYESIHPPLYYVASAVAWSVVPSVLMLRVLNVLVGILAFVAMLRLASCFPGVDPMLGASVLAFLPGFLTTSAAVSNGPLAVLFGICALQQIVTGFRAGFTVRRTTWLTLALAAGALTAEGGLIYLPAAGVAMMLRRDWRPLAAVSAGVAALAGWWYGRNVLLFGDPFRWHAEHVLLAQLPGLPDVAMSAIRYWAHVAVGMAVTLPGVYRNWLPLPVYAIYGGLATATIAGCVENRPRVSGEAMFIGVAGVGAASIFVAYNYLHFMPMARLMYPALPVAALVVGRAARRHAAGIIVALVVGAALTVATMPRNWIDPGDEPAFRHVIQTFRTEPLPTGF